MPWVSRWALLGLVAGCYQPTIRTGAPCETADDCPSGQACVANVCGGTGEVDAAVTEIDAADAADAASDGPPPMQVVVGTNPSQVRDTVIWGDFPTTNYGDLDHFSVDGTETGLLWFDLAGISPMTTVLSATLTVRVADDADEDGGTVTLHRMREAWTEGEASWIARTTGQAWTLSGARPPARDAAAVATIVPDAVGKVIAVPLPNELVQAWISQPATNFGIAFVPGTASQHVHLRTRESGISSTLTLLLQP